MSKIQLDVKDPKGLLKYIFELSKKEPPTPYPRTAAAFEKEKTSINRSKDYVVD